MRLLICFLIFTTSCFGQNSPKEMLLDSINKTRESDRGAFNLYIKKPEFEMIPGGFRNRETSQQGFEPFTFTPLLVLSPTSNQDRINNCW